MSNCKIHFRCWWMVAIIYMCYLADSTTCSPSKSALSCLNGGKMSINGDCQCAPRFTGLSCEEAVCIPGCLNGGTCVAPDVCSCPPGYHGDYCGIPICNPSCQNGGTCSAPDICTCPTGYTGNICQQPICSPSCQNGGQCVGPDDCQCPPGYIGESCEQAVCTLPCLNGGECVSPDTCSCPPGYYGDQCELAICNPSCQNGGTCSAPDACTCPPGYTGNACQTPFCSQPCLNGGECTGPNTCTCPSWKYISGPRCERVPLYRYFNDDLLDHFYTTDKDELRCCVNGGEGYHYQGVQCSVLSIPIPGQTKPLLRYWNSIALDHLYTLDENEIGTTTEGDVGLHGYKFEGEEGYCFPNRATDTVPLHRYVNVATQDHFYTTNCEEIGTTSTSAGTVNGHRYEGVACYVYPMNVDVVEQC